MHVTTSKTRRRVASTALLSAALGAAGLGGLAPHAAPARAATAPSWVTTQGKIVHLTLIAGWNNTNAGFNFDGGAHGRMVVTVPLGDKIVATFKNDAQGAAHDAVIIRYTLPLPGSSSTPAFPGAASPTPRFGAFGARQTAAQTFSFTAGKAGTYMLVCGIAGHALAGMWDLFVVSPSARAASVRFDGTGGASVSSGSAAASKTTTWAMTSGKTVHLRLVAGWNNVNAGFNFDGAANGQMVVTVPLGDKIVATYSNAATTPHDVRIINYQKPLPSHTVALAFAGASTGGGGFGGSRRGGPPGGAPGTGSPPPGQGSFPRFSNKPQTFTFIANKAGTYMIMCGFPGHALAGMWDTFVVSKTAKSASVAFK